MFHRARRRVEALLAGREPESATSEVETLVRQLIAEHFDLDGARLRLDDHLVDDLDLDTLDSLATVEFVMDLEEKAGAFLPDWSVATWETVADVVRHVETARLGQGRR